MQDRIKEFYGENTNVNRVANIWFRPSLKLDLIKIIGNEKIDEKYKNTLLSSYSLEEEAFIVYFLAKDQKLINRSIPISFTQTNEQH